MIKWIVIGGFEESRRRASIAGRVTMADAGERVAGAPMVARSAGHEARSRTDDNGMFWFGNMPDGEYTVAVASPEGGSSSRQRSDEARVQWDSGRAGASPAWVEIHVGAAKAVRRKGA